MARVLLPVLLVLSSFALFSAFGREAPAGRAELRWWKGNTHTHTLWSDGDAPPEVAAKWYKESGYHFLVLSDHNVLSEGERWFALKEGRFGEAELRQVVDAHGPDWCATRVAGEVVELRLKTLPELRAAFEEKGRFLFLQGEEISATGTRGEASVPVHVNAVNIEELIPAPALADAREVMQACVQAVMEQSARTKRPMLAHLNHPNFGWGLTWEDVAHVAGERFFEVYNGHRGVSNAGDAEHVSTEEMWDRANTLRLTELGLPLLYGVATDDAHSYWGPDQVSIPGRGWVVVRAAELSGDEIVNAMKRGDFYASSGVELEDVVARGRTLTVEIRAEEGVQYTTRFLGTRLEDGEMGAAGAVLATTGANPAVYTFDGDELFVRAVVTSSRPHPDPYAQGDMQTAWTQPVQPRR